MDERISQSVACFYNMLQKISHTYKHISDEAIENYSRDIEDVLAGYCNIRDRFTAIGCGAFKECYELNDDFVIKFVSEYNNTRDEEVLMSKAVEENVGEIFIPTWYCYLSSVGPELLMLDEDASDRYYYNYEEHIWVNNLDYNIQHATCIIIQPRILRAVSEEPYTLLPNNKLDYNKTPIVDSVGQVVDYWIAHNFRVSSQTWLQDVVSAYGLEYFNRLEEFLNNNDVYDLHSGNIGYYVNKDGKTVPVIFDCLSRGR